jgi:hypothetical protein
MGLCLEEESARTAELIDLERRRNQHLRLIRTMLALAGLGPACMVVLRWIRQRGSY